MLDTSSQVHMPNSAAKKLRALEYLRCGGSVAEAAKKFKTSRQTIYNWKCNGNDRDGDLQDRSRAHKTHKHKTPPETVVHLRTLAIQNPQLGGTALTKLIKAPHRQLSPQTVNGILRQLNLASEDHRWHELERQLRDRPQFGWGLGTKLEDYVVSRNARYRDVTFRGMRPGEALAIGVVGLGTFKDAETIILACVVDTYTGLAFGRLGKSDTKAPIADALIPALDFFDDLNLPTRRVKIHNTRKTTNKLGPSFTTLLRARDLEVGTAFDIDWRRKHRESGLVEAKIEKSISGFIIQFKRDAMAGLFGALDGRAAYNIEDLQLRFHSWISRYNSGCKLDGYPNYGLSPTQVLRQALNPEGHMASKVELPTASKAQ
jgi:transposase